MYTVVAFYVHHIYFQMTKLTKTKMISFAQNNIFSFS